MDISQTQPPRAIPEQNHDAASLEGTLKSPARKQIEHEGSLPRGIQAWGVDIALFLGMLVFLAALAQILRIPFAERPGTDHFVQQAQAWLHGHSDVVGLSGHDFVLVNGKHYIVYPPFPAFIMLPFIAVLGSQFSEVWFAWLAGAANVALTYRLLEAMRRRDWTWRTQRENVIMALVFGLGTIALWLTLGGEVWFVAQTLAITGLLVMLYGAVSQRWWLASIGVGAAFLTRSPDVLGGLFVLVAFARAHAVGVPNGSADGRWWQRVQWLPSRWPALKDVLALSIPFLAAFAIFVVRNKLYFGNFLDSGYDLQVHQNYTSIKHGLLSWHYLWPNIAVDFLNFPSFAFRTPTDVTPHIDLMQGGNGTSIFFTTPLFLLLFVHYGKTRQPWAHITLWFSAGLLVIFSLLWNLTGWSQVGARYLFDAYPFLIMLLAMRAGGITKWWLALATYGVIINIILASTFWCNNNRCLGAGYTTKRHLLLFGLLAGVVAATVLAWQWLRQEHHAADEEAVLSQ